MSREELERNIKLVLEGFERGLFVRGTSGDGDPAWAIKLMPYLVALGKLAKEVEVLQ
jgi:hypothetical protein